MMHSHTHVPAIAAPVSMLVLVVGLTVTAADLPMAWLVWPLGYGVVLPLAIGYATRESEQGDEETDQLAELQDRYAAGEVSEAEFEAELESVLSTEDDQR
ncbi:SHOCT domain-containing protein [Salinibaculum salinum]|uniref:SHOCT domain-containing protein n=1 Tax=Salinibaculum salinum TaxID=3131996 RepID=UPI0030EF13E7